MTNFEKWHLGLESKDLINEEKRETYFPCLFCPARNKCLEDDGVNIDKTCADFFMKWSKQEAKCGSSGVNMDMEENINGK